MNPVKFGLGQPLRRLEDERLLTGAGRYGDDQGADFHAIVLRSPHAHARFTIGDTNSAAAMPGVALILTARDLTGFGDLPCTAPMDNSDGSKMALPPYPLLARDIVRHAGDAIAFVVAASEMQARDAAARIDVTYESLPAVTGLDAALKPDAPRVWPELGSNLAFDTELGDAAGCAALFAKADRVVGIDIVNNRVVANYLEPRMAIGSFDPLTGAYTLTAPSQGVHFLRDIIAGNIMHIAPERLRVLSGDVGGGFGPKAFVFREYPLVLEAARRCGGSVKWVCDRNEHFLADAHGRDNHARAEMALDARGRFLALRADIRANLGAYLSQFAPYIPWLGATMASGPYDIGAVHVRVRGVYTHTAPVDAYRGAGRPEAAYLLERLVDRCARAMNLPREELRAKNFVEPAQMPYRTPTGRTYDVGDFEAAMRQALAKASYNDFAARAAAAKVRGKIRGIGLASYIECTAWDDGEAGSVTLDEDGSFTALVGTQSSGQGHETAYAQVVAGHFDISAERVRVVQGDTARLATGGGTGGSRSIPVGAVMFDRAAAALAAKLEDLAADELEVSKADLEFADGGLRVKGTDRALSFAQIAALPAATHERRTGQGEFTPPVPTYPNGTHVCEVEIDPETGETAIVGYTICDDFGTILNPLLLEGQVHGGIAQGIGQALCERVVYGDDGQLISASLMDYCLPRAADLPSFAFETRSVPSTTNPLGLKGAGEAGSIGASPAVMNAVADALFRAYGIADIDMPATPARIAEIIRAVV